MYEALTCFIDKIDAKNAGQCIFDKNHKGTLEDPIQMPWIRYEDSVLQLVDAIYQFVDGFKDFDLKKYNDVLEKSNIKWTMESMSSANVSELDGTTVLALLIGLVRAERFCDGALLHCIEDGTVLTWLARLKEIDDSKLQREQ